MICMVMIVAISWKPSIVPDLKNLDSIFLWSKSILRSQKKNVFRGLHFQLNPFAQTKIVLALSGAVIDLVVDLRKTSDTYLKYYKIKLDSPDKALWVPKGFAHGYFTLEDHTCFQYAVDRPYHAASERSLSIYDPKLNITEDFTGAVFSPKDLASQSFNEIENEI